MINYNEELDALFEDWKKASIANGDGEFLSKDGLMKKANNDINILWKQSDKKILFLLKDQPYGGGDDTRNWLLPIESNNHYEENSRVVNSFLRRLAYLLYGFTYKEFNPDNISEEQLIKCFNEIPFAFVEAKKQSGKGVAPNRLIRKYISSYKQFLIKEIEILNPNIIICCGIPQYEFVINDVFSKNELIHIDNNLFYHKEKQIIIVHTWHPGIKTHKYCGKITDEIFYKYAMLPVQKFIEQYPDML